MKVMRLVLCLILFLAINSSKLQAQDSKEDQRMTLEECIEYAFKTNSSMVDALIDTKIAESTVGEVKSAGLPQVNAQIQYSNNYADFTSFCYLFRF